MEIIRWIIVLIAGLLLHASIILHTLAGLVR